MRRARFVDRTGTIKTGEWAGDSIHWMGRTYAVDEVDVLPPVAPGKVLGIGRNYRDRFDSPDEYPDPPRIWFKGGPHVVTGHGSTVSIPDTGEVLFEAELGVVIGERCRYVAPDDVARMIKGYTCANDLTNKAHSADGLNFRVKSFDNAAPLGPAIASPDHVPDNPRIRLWVNGEKMQDSADTGLVYDVSEAVSEFSTYLTLEPDDVILMGTPGGLRPLEDGDHVEIAIDGIGRLEHDVVVESDPRSSRRE